VIKGRRRIGKSRLIEEYCLGKESLTFIGLPLTKTLSAKDQRNEFAWQFQKQTGGSYNEHFSTSVGCRSGAVLGSLNYLEGIYFSAPLLSVLWPVIKDWPVAQIAGLLTTFYLGESSTLGAEFDKSLRAFLSEIHRLKCASCRKNQNTETHRTHILGLIDSTRGVVQHLPDSLVLEFYKEMIEKNSLIERSAELLSESA